MNADDPPIAADESWSGRPLAVVVDPATLHLIAEIPLLSPSRRQSAGHRRSSAFIGVSSLTHPSAQPITVKLRGSISRSPPWH